MVALFEIKDDADGMRTHAGDSSTVERFALRIMLGSEVGETELVLNLRTEFEPTEIEIAAGTNLHEIVEPLGDKRFFAIFQAVVTHASTDGAIGADITVSLSRPFEFERNGDGDAQQGRFVLVRRLYPFAIVVDCFVFIIKLPIRKMQLRNESEIEVAAETDVSDEAHRETRHHIAATRMDIRILQIGGHILRIFDGTGEGLGNVLKRIIHEINAQ